MDVYLFEIYNFYLVEEEIISKVSAMNIYYFVSYPAIFKKYSLINLPKVTSISSAMNHFYHLNGHP